MARLYIYLDFSILIEFRDLALHPFALGRTEVLELLADAEGDRCGPVVCGPLRSDLLRLFLCAKRVPRFRVHLESPVGSNLCDPTVHPFLLGCAIVFNLLTPM